MKNTSTKQHSRQANKNAICLACGNTFLTKPRTTGKYCCLVCSRRRKQQLIDCTNCNEKFWRLKSQIEKREIHFCSRLCRNSYDKGKTRKQELIRCKNCNNEFSRNVKHIQRAKSHFCDILCRTSYDKGKPREHRRVLRITKNCLRCLKKFSCIPSLSEAKFCSKECKTKARSAKKTTCLRCGVSFNIHSNKRYYCSEICRRPLVMLDCLQCLNTFRSQPYFIGKRKFCSIRCYRRFTGETEPEKNVRLILESKHIEYIQEYKTEGWRYPSDFYLPNQNLIIEVDEPYWHDKTKDRDLRKKLFLESKGYTVERITATPFYGTLTSKMEKEFDNLVCFSINLI
jgi:Protein of unknown function (DUF559)